MAIDTVNRKLSVLNLGLVWHSSTPISPGAIGQDDQQQLLWGYPGILWGEEIVVEGDVVITENAYFAMTVITKNGER